jgi:hypothetical protein
MKTMQVKIDPELAEVLRAIKKNDGKSIEFVVNQAVRLALKLKK